jgi:chromosome segregation ATPase
MIGIEESNSVGRLPRARFAVRVAAAFVAVVFAGTTSAAGTYKWTDEQGGVHYSDKAPPETPAKGATLLDKQGRQVKKIEPPLTPEQTKAKADEEERQRALAKAKDDQARKDKALMQSYTSESEIEIARNRAISTLESQIKSAEVFSADLARRQKNIAKQKASYGSKPIPIELERESTAVDNELSHQTILIRQKQEELTLVTAKYDTIKQRWREILADQQRAAAAAAELEAAKAQNPPASAKPGAPKPVTTARPASTTNK